MQKHVYFFCIFGKVHPNVSLRFISFFLPQTSRDGTRDFKFQNSIFASFRSILSLHVTNLPRVTAVGVVVSIGLSAAADDLDG